MNRRKMIKYNRTFQIAIFGAAVFYLTFFILSTFPDVFAFPFASTIVAGLSAIAVEWVANKTGFFFI